MKSVCIIIEVEGTWCNQWPKLKLSVNDNIYFDGEVAGSKTLHVQTALLDTNTLIIQHYDKSFGENGQWDTKAVNGQITHDRAIKLKSVFFDDVDISKYVANHFHFVTDQGEQLQTDYFGFNGRIEIMFKAPVYDWIINKFIKNNFAPESDFLIETSFDQLFDYSQDQLELDELVKILQENAYLFGKSASL